MRTFGPFYPAPLQAVVNHAERLADLVAAPAVAADRKGKAAAWLTGRAEEIESFVEQVAEDWRARRVGVDHAARMIESYLAELHCGLRDELGIDFPDCCFGSQTATARMTHEGSF